VLYNIHNWSNQWVFCILRRTSWINSDMFNLQLCSMISDIDGSVRFLNDLQWIEIWFCCQNITSFFFNRSNIRNKNACTTIKPLHENNKIESDWLIFVFTNTMYINEQDQRLVSLEIRIMFLIGATCLLADCCVGELVLWKSNSACWSWTKRASPSFHLM
jgi:hypothetical protein